MNKGSPTRVDKANALRARVRSLKLKHLEEYRQKVRSGLHRPGLLQTLLSPIYALGAMIVVAAVDGLFGGCLTGIIFGLAIPTAIIFHRRRKSGRSIELTDGFHAELRASNEEANAKRAIFMEEMKRLDEADSSSVQASLLKFFEYIALIALTFTLTAIIVRWMRGFLSGELGFAGLFFLGIALIIAFTMSMTFIVFQKNYLRDAYLQRWLGVVGVSVAILLYFLVV